MFGQFFLKYQGETKFHEISQLKYWLVSSYMHGSILYFFLKLSFRKLIGIFSQNFRSSSYPIVKKLNNVQMISSFKRKVWEKLIFPFKIKCETYRNLIILGPFNTHCNLSWLTGHRGKPKKADFVWLAKAKTMKKTKQYFFDIFVFRKFDKFDFG